MTNIILTCIFILAAIQIGIFAWAFYLLRREKQKIEARIALFFNQPDEKTPSEFAALVDVMSKMAGRAIAMEVKTTLMGKASGSARQEAAIAGDLVSDMIGQQSPLIAGILNSFPQLKKRLIKQPELAAAAMNLFNRNGQPGRNGTGDESQHGDVQMDLKL